jgi:AbrB family looped-hinge helix DNA binding protein
MASATVTSKGQVTIPAEVRAALGLREGSTVDFVPTPAGSYEMVVHRTSIRDLKGALPPPQRPLSLADMDDAIARAAAESARVR